MTETHENKLPVWFWVVTVVLVLWGLMGLYVFYDYISSTPEKMAKYVADGELSQGYVDGLMNTPAWAKAVFALAVFTGALGALCLTLRKSWAVGLYALSLLFILLSFVDMFVIRKLHVDMTSAQIGMEGVVLILGIFAFWFSRKSKSNGWLK